MSWLLPRIAHAFFTSVGLFRLVVKFSFLFLIEFQGHPRNIVVTIATLYLLCYQKLWTRISSELPELPDHHLLLFCTALHSSRLKWPLFPEMVLISGPLSAHVNKVSTMCVCACVRACVHVCVHVCVCACVSVWCVYKFSWAQNCAFVSSFFRSRVDLSNISGPHKCDSRCTQKESMSQGERQKHNSLAIPLLLNWRRFVGHWPPSTFRDASARCLLIG